MPTLVPTLVPTCLLGAPAGVAVVGRASPEQAAAALAERVAGALRAAIAARGQASLWVSGGSTPVPFFQALSRQVLDWPRVQVGLVDERWCPPDDPDSNEALVCSHLLSHEARRARWLGWYRPGDEQDAVSEGPFAAEADLQAALEGCAWPADVVVLGLGGDGHTASWFPETPEYAAALSPAMSSAMSSAMSPRGVAVSAPARPNVPKPRFTLTLGAVRNSRLICLHFTGVAKAELMARIWAGEPAPVGAVWSVPMPEGSVLPPVEVYWAP
jgi:6-phosphogluconolactonase